MDGFTVRSIDDVVDVWVLADMYQIEGIKFCCMSKLENHWSVDNVDQMLEEVLKLLSCPACSGLKGMCQHFLKNVVSMDNVLDVWCLAYLNQMEEIEVLLIDVLDEALYRLGCP